MKDEYADIIDLPHRVSDKHPRMPLRDRAAQFAPFAALTGFEAAIEETARTTQERVELGESAAEELDRRLRYVGERLGETPEVTVTFFVPDGKKNGGRYERITGRVSRLDTVGRLIVLTDGRRIPMDGVTALDGAFFPESEP